MLGHPPITRCFVVLCFGTAAALIVFEWRSPFPGAQPLLTNVKLPPRPVAALTQWFRGGQPESIADAPTVSPEETTVKLVVRLSARQLEVYEQGKRVKQYDVAIGKDDWQTPVGEFEIIQMQQQPAWQHPITKAVIEPGPDNPLGSHWVGFWQEGESQIGFHGTNQAELVGQAVSHGCVRMRNSDIQDLYGRIALGTVVAVIP